MIRILAAEIDLEDPPQSPQKTLRQNPLDKATIPDAMPDDIPMADDDLEFIGETQGVPVPQAPKTPEGEPRPEGLPAEDFDEIFPEPLKESEELPPQEQDEDPFPEDEFEEITEELTELDKLNMSLSIPAKLDKAMSEGYPLRIIYTTLKGHTTERTVRPDYYLPARTTGNWVLIAWCELRNDWRGFVVNRIRAAKLEAKND